jgi:hypothetical protein
MADDVDAAKKQSHGRLWYIGWALVFYFASFPLVLVLSTWLLLWGRMPTPVAAGLTFFYKPIEWIIVAAGGEDEVSRFVESAVGTLPLPPMAP